MINRMYVITLLSVLPFTACGSAQGGEKAEAPEVYFIREITPQNMVRIYEALERPATGKVAVKLSTGEPGGHNYLKPELIKDIVTKVGGTIVECNTAYGGGRARTQDHLKAAADHGFTAIAPVDIMDADGEVSLPVKGGKHLKENFVGSHYPRYDFTVVLSHFKGHAMGGFGGAVKNISIGIASSPGKRGYTRRARPKTPPKCGATSRRRTIFWSRWPSRPSRSPTTAATRFSTSAS